MVALMNLNDKTLGFNVLSTFNAVYQCREANVVYSNYVEFYLDHSQMFKGYSDRYTHEQIANYQFRETNMRFGSLLTFRLSLIPTSATPPSCCRGRQSPR